MDRAYVSHLYIEYTYHRIYVSHIEVPTFMYSIDVAHLGIAPMYHIYASPQCIAAM